MDALRLSLFIIGIFIIAAVYWWSQRAEKPTSRREPTINSASLPPTLNSDAISEHDLQTHGHINASPVKHEMPPSAAEAVFYAATHAEQLILSLTIMGHHGARFSGDAIVQALHAHQFIHGEMRIFHYFADQQRLTPVFSVANILEPGIFDIEKLHAFETPGLVIFMRLPGPIEPRKALDTLLEVARGIAVQLHGDLCDESRNVLTPQAIEYLREKVETFRLKQKKTEIPVKDR